MLEDGRYDGVVIDAHRGTNGAVSVELAIASGTHKGDVVTLRAEASAMGDTDPLDWLGLPMTIEVREGEPRLSPG